MRTKNLKNVWWPNTDEHLADRENHGKSHVTRNFQGEVAFPQAPHPKAAACYDCYPPKFAIEQGTSQRTNRGDVPVLLFFVAKGSILACYHYLSLLSVNVQKIIQNFNQFQSSFASFLSQSLERSSEKITKGQGCSTCELLRHAAKL